MGTLSRWDLVRHETLGIGRVEAVFGPGENPKCAVYFPRNDQQLMVPREELSPLSATEAAAFDLVKLALYDLRAEDAPQTELAERWTGGELVLKPASPERESKTIPLDTFFHKIVMLRDRLRVLEQHINAHKSLSDADKVQVQQYITRIYGTLTTFNILFKNREDQFIGQKGED
ncbi:MAG: hypothetical protein HY207_13635 [Nitrospirae bacterium]|nr:hypothetical protein [Nitrospirota bacterium]